MPTLPSSKPGNIRNTSKYEISFVNGLNKIHKQKYKDHEIFSYVNKNGEQFKVKNFTADWFCKSCKIAFFIEGQFKYICNNHKLPFDKRRAYLNENGLRKRKLFKKISKLEVDQIFVIGQCCIVKKDYPQLFKESNLYDSKLPQMVLNNLKIFKKEKYDRIHYQKAILPPFTLYLEKEFRASGGSSATKYDINSAYLSCLTNPSFLLPESNQPIKIFVNEDSNKYFQSLKSEDKIFAIMKAFIVVPLNTEFPFLPIRSKDKGIGYSFCYKCFKSDCKPELCSHSDSERGFFSEGYLSDFLFMKKMGYKITCVHIIEFKAMHHKGLHDIAACLLQLRKVDSDIVRTISKLCALIGIGRYALNIDKNSNCETKVIDNCDELFIGIEQKDIKNIEFYGNCAVAFKEKIMTNSENSKLSSRLNCCSLLFGSLSNAVRREIYKFYLYLKNIDGINIIRIDTDSIIISYLKTEHIDFIKDFINQSFFDYKVEIENINRVISFSKQAHYIKTERSKFLKVTGLRLSIQDRFDLE